MINWQQKRFDKKIYDFLKEHNYDDLIAQLIAQRIDDVKDIDDYLKPKIKNLMPSPFSIKDMDKAAKFLVDSIKNNKRIAIFGDYDVDGASSAAILAKFLANFGIDYKIYIPDRIIEGYGPNIKALMQLKDEGYDLVITVDCGTTAFDALAAASENNLDILVVDHHLSESEIPQAIAVINPNRFDDKSDLNYLCGAGVSFMLLIAVNSSLKQEGYYKEHQVSEVNLLKLLDIVALATICDIVPLVKLNRAFVTQGLKIIANTENKGLRSLFEIADVELDQVNAFHLGFIIGPRINAGGRVGKSTVASELLASNDDNAIKNHAKMLNHYNAERKAIEQIVLEKSLAMIEQQNLAAANMIIVANENWHPGVIGIVASRIKEKYQKPVAVIALENGIGKASVRSVEGVNMGDVIHQAKANGLLIAGGGHSMAAGFSVDEEKVNDLTEFLQNIENDNQAKLEYDSEIKFSNVNFGFLDQLKILEPFGRNNETPVFLIKDLMVSNHFFMKEKHLKLSLVDKNSGMIGGKIDSIIWNFDQYDILPKILGQSFNVICQIIENQWQNKRQLRLEISEFDFN